MTTDEDPFEEVKPLGQILSLADLKALPPPAPMIEGILGHRSAVLMVGATGSNKTFASVGLGLSVATGKPWLGHRVAVRGHVVFVIGEGAHGLASRIDAWEQHHSTTVLHRRVSFVLKPASLTEVFFWEALTRHAQERGARLVILDTLSSLAPGVDETKESAAVLRYMSDLSSDIDGTVILVHHTGWGPQDRARGGSQFESNADEVIVLQKTSDEEENPIVTIKRKKVKESASGRIIQVRRKLVAASAVLELVGEGGTTRVDTKQGKRDEVRGDILRLLEANPYLLGKTDVKNEVGGKADIFLEVWRDLERTKWIVSRSERKENDQRASLYWAMVPLEDME